MSCNLRQQTIVALRAEAQGSIQKARVNVEVYLHNPVGIGEHPDVLSAIQNQLDVISEQEERIQVLDKYFNEPHTH
jgi:ABC-type amino acid transport substrate-binding protein